ncbi:MAG: hypothetical protein RBR47_10770 [Bacteroidales bacterium]|nr:hypothetical protein [Bacteroidales bacterium]NCU36802.1 hypothetical protein [Candidatus Falkowbacteria bacterium]MDD3132234.1 hypothetical protein [Bacteroidales bacterium]MDD3526670.1 hypothetical protein [Bacteroidales bacterium]MDD4177603.1 hypothetical protein [Bacteroidales bacterium]
MRRTCFLLIMILTLGFSATSQEIPTETFRQHVIAITETNAVQEKYLVEEQDRQRVYYINLGCYDQYHQMEPLQNKNGDVYLWNEGAIAFHDVIYTLNLLRIRQPEENIAFYELVYHDGKTKYFIEVKFVKRYQKWELVDTALTKLKEAY